MFNYVIMNVLFIIMCSSLCDFCVLCVVHIMWRDMTVVCYSFWTDQHSDIEINRYFFIFERIFHFWTFQPPPPRRNKCSRAAADRRKKFKNFEPPPPRRNKCSRAAADKRKKFENFEQPPPIKSSAYTSRYIHLIFTQFLFSSNDNDYENGMNQIFDKKDAFVFI